MSVQPVALDEVREISERRIELLQLAGIEHLHVGEACLGQGLRHFSERNPERAHALMDLAADLVNRILEVFNVIIVEFGFPAVDGTPDHLRHDCNSRLGAVLVGPNLQCQPARNVLLAAFQLLPFVGVGMEVVQKASVAVLAEHFVPDHVEHLVAQRIVRGVEVVPQL